MKKNILYVIFSFFFISIAIFSCNHDVYAEDLTMSSGERRNFTSSTSGCKSTNPTCVSANGSSNYVGNYSCNVVASGDNCTAVVTVGPTVYNITVGDPSQAEDVTPSEEIDVTLTEEESVTYTSGSSVCTSDNPSCVVVNSSSLYNGGYSCQLTAVKGDCSANVTIGSGNGIKLVHVNTNAKTHWWDRTEGEEADNSTNNDGTLTCDYIFGDYNDPEYFGYYLAKLLEVIKFAGPILVVMMTIVDLIKVLTSGKNDELTKFVVKTIKRVIYAVLLFMIPSLLDWVFKLVGIYGICGVS